MRGLGRGKVGDEHSLRYSSVLEVILSLALVDQNKNSFEITCHGRASEVYQRMFISHRGCGCFEKSVRFGSMCSKCLSLSDLTEHV